jgi:hypothetical protein
MAKKYTTNNRRSLYMYFMLIVLVNLMEMLLCTSLLGSAARFVEWEVGGDALAFAQDWCMWRGKGMSIERRGPVHSVREGDFEFFDGHERIGSNNNNIAFFCLFAEAKSCLC